MSRTVKIVLIGIAIIVGFQLLRVTIKSARGQDVRQTVAAGIVSSCVRDIRGFSPEDGRRRCECFRDAIMPLITDDEIRRFSGTSLPPQMAEKMKIAAAQCTDQ